MGIRVGIDLGTTFSAVARMLPSGSPAIIKNQYGLASTPSVVSINPDGSVSVGQDAKDALEFGDINTAAFFKQSMGRDYVLLECGGREYTAEMLSSILLKELVHRAELVSGERIDAAVITVPAYFRSRERSATIAAAENAGIRVLNIINEPTAAVMAYGADKAGEQTVLIYDLGGGTFDVTVARVSGDGIFVLGCSGDHELGGRNWDMCIAGYIADRIADEDGIDISADDEANAKITVAAEKAKKQLSALEKTTAYFSHNGKRYTIEISRSVFEKMTRNLVQETGNIINSLLAELNISWSGIDGVILVGGSTRMPMISSYIEQMTGRPPLGGINVDEAVALGAAIAADLAEDGAGMPLLPSARKIVDASAHSLGMIALNKDGNRYINSIIIGKNTPVPASETRVYDFRTNGRHDELEIYVLQGESERVLDNNILNKYKVTGMKHLTGGKTRIAVSFGYDANTVVGVSAVQRETGRSLTVEEMPVPENMSWTDEPPVKPEAVDAAVLLSIDLSGSMDGEPLVTAMEAMNGFIDSMEPLGIRVGIIGFASRLKLICEPCDDYGLIRSKIRCLPDVDVGIETCAEPFGEAFKVMKEQSGLRYIVTLTDGCWDRPNEAIKNARACIRDGIESVALGFGSAKHSFLKKIASKDDLASLTKLSGLEGSFSKIAQVIGESAGLKNSFDFTQLRCL